MFIVLYNYKETKRKMNNVVLNNEIKTFTCIFTDGTKRETVGTDKYLADEYFKLVAQLEGKQVKEVKEK